jgi:hypothetical protein
MTKLMSLFTSIAVLHYSTVSAAAASDITVKDLGNSQYELTLHTSTTVNIFEAQRELAPTAKKTCADMEAHFGHYAFAINEPLSGPAGKTADFTLTQTVRCGSVSPPAIAQTTSAPDGWEPTAKTSHKSKARPTDTTVPRTRATTQAPTPCLPTA